MVSLFASAVERSSSAAGGAGEPSIEISDMDRRPPRDGVHRAAGPVGQLVQSSVPLPYRLMAVLLAKPGARATPYFSGWSSDRATQRHRHCVTRTLMPRSLYGAPDHAGRHASRSIRVTIRWNRDRVK